MRRILRQALWRALQKYSGMTATSATTLALGLAALGVGYWGWGWRGLVLGATVVVFVLLLQFSRALRAMRQAASQHKGSVASAVMLQAQLQKGMRLAQVMRLAGSFGLPADVPAEAAGASAEETFVWRDEGGASVHVALRGGQVVRWQLVRDA
jgi:multisubunit Na+/H+ antiporter MnhG subunit